MEPNYGHRRACGVVAFAVVLALPQSGETATTQLIRSASRLAPPTLSHSPATPYASTAARQPRVAPNYAKGDVFVGVGNGLIAHYDNQGNLLENLNSGTGSTEITGMGFDLDGNLYATEFSVNAMAKFDNAGNLLVQPWGGPFDRDPESITFDDQQNIYVGQADGTGQVLKFDRQGTLLATYAPAREDRGTDWITLSRDGCTLFYTSEGQLIHRFDICANTQLSNFAVLPTSPAYALRLRPNGEVMVAATSAVHRLDAAGNLLRSYNVATYGEPSFFFALNLDPDNETFWTAGYSSGNIYRIRISDGTLISSFNAPHYVTVAGLAIVGEIALPNHPPTCDAGGPYAASCQGPTTSIRLDGRRSTDQDPGDVITYSWTTTCPGGTFDDPTSARPTLSVDTSRPADIGCLVTLAVNDGHSNGRSTCEASVQVGGCSNQPPVCDAGPAQSGTVCEPIRFDGGGSNDPEGGPLKFQWNFGDGESAEGENLKHVTHVYRADTESQTYNVQLTVTDDHGLIATCVTGAYIAATHGHIRGTVVGLNGKAVLGAPVRVFRPLPLSQPPVGSALTTNTGEYDIAISPGFDYAVSCDPAGYWGQVATGISICPMDRRDVSFTLVKREEMAGIVLSDQSGFAAGAGTTASIGATVRAPTAGKYRALLEPSDASRFTVTPGSGYVDLGRLDAGQVAQARWSVLDNQGTPTKSPSSLLVSLFKQGSTRPIDSDILPVVVDRPLSDNPADGFTSSEARRQLEKYQPAFLLSSGEPYPPQDVDVMLDRATLAYADVGKMSPKTAVHRGMLAPYGVQEGLLTPYLDLYGDGSAGPDNYSPLSYPCRIYGTANKVGENLYLSYWCFFFFEDWTCAKHEGDWEGVLVSLSLQDGQWQPEKMALAHHPLLTGATDVLQWKDVEKLKINGRDVPKVFVSKQAHGMYPHGGNSRTSFGCTDEHDGAGLSVFPLDAPRIFSNTLYADVAVLPRVDFWFAYHPGAWTAFAGEFGFTLESPVNALFAPPRSPVLAGSFRWTDPGSWIADEAIAAATAWGNGLGGSETVEVEGPSGSRVSMRAGKESMFVVRGQPGSAVALEIYDIGGRRIRTIRSSVAPNGASVITWDGRSDESQAVRQGMYFYRVQTDGDDIGTGKVVRVK